MNLKFFPLINIFFNQKLKYRAYGLRVGLVVEGNGIALDAKLQVNIMEFQKTKCSGCASIEVKLFFY